MAWRWPSKALMTTLETMEPLCSLNVSRVSHGLPPRKRCQVVGQGGNAMTIVTIGSILQYMHLFFEFVDIQRCGGAAEHGMLSKWRRVRGKPACISFIKAPSVKCRKDVSENDETVTHLPVCEMTPPLNRSLSGWSERGADAANAAAPAAQVSVSRGATTANTKTKSKLDAFLESRKRARTNA